MLCFKKRDSNWLCPFGFWSPTDVTKQTKEKLVKKIYWFAIRRQSRFAQYRIIMENIN